MSTPQTVLVTGASTGFGRDTAETLARAGHRVYASMRDVGGRNRPHADALQRLATAEGLAITPTELDVTDADSVHRAVAAIVRAAGRIDVLVNNAGRASAGVSEAFTPEQALALFDVNVIGVLRTTRAVLPTMRRQGTGLVLNLGSVLGRVTFPFFGLYGASKFAIEALTDSYRYELAPLGIDVVLVQPSAYPTPMYANLLQPADQDRVVEYGATGEIPGVMFQRFGSLFDGPDAPNPHDVAEAVARLVALPKGERPARTVVGVSYGADRLNAATAPVQADVVRALGLAHLDAVA
jgi:NAD(P)-dependent dehydrogenase (short-subunit alcohol dehydrogenase family)